MDFLHQDYQYYLDEAKTKERALIQDAAVFRDICTLSPRRMLCKALFAVGKRIIRIAEYIEAKEESGPGNHHRRDAA